MLRRKAADWLKAQRDQGGVQVDPVRRERLAKGLELASGIEFGEDHRALSLEETGVDPWARSLKWKVQPPERDLEAFSVVVIGSGIGGLNAAAQLKRAGIPFQVIEKNADVGGTWLENRYPGIRIDAPSNGYNHIFGGEFRQKYTFCPGDDNLQYLNWVADSFDLRRHITFDTEVRQLRWDDDSSEWEIEVEDVDGTRILRSKGVVTSVGFLNRPMIPEIEGMADFSGPAWHSARWPEGFDLKGKRIAVIGTGCSGYQMIPELARQADRVVVFQRRPQWIIPVPGYQAELPPDATWLERNLPLYRNFLRFKFSLVTLLLIDLVTIDPDFDDPYAVNELNREQREICIAFLEEKLGPELVAKMTPPHPVGSARPVNVDPQNSVLDALNRDNVELVTDGIRRIDRDGIEAADGSRHDVDAIVYATGFEATKYLFPIEVIGRDGRTLEEAWAAKGSRAYRGVMMPGFPNLWTIYGPNTNAGLPAPALHEMAMVFALKCMEHMICEDVAELEPKVEAFERWNEMIDERNMQMAWSDPRARNYWWTELGRSATQNPLRPDELWRALNFPDFDELEMQR
jgi:4-hydroxyacetophenone monooxygenase